MTQKEMELKLKELKQEQQEMFISALLDQVEYLNEKMDLLDSILIDWVSVSIDALNLIQGINGRSEDTFNKILTILKNMENWF